MEDHLIKLWLGFSRDVYKATSNLFALLYGVEQTRNLGHGIPKPSYLDVTPIIDQPSWSNKLRLGGEVEQIAYKGWVAEVWRIWEDRYRRQFEKTFIAQGVTNPIRPTVTIMGDFRLIRNDFLHGSGKASQESTGNCEELTWFNIGDQIVLEPAHVIDFLHRLGLLSLPPMSAGEEPFMFIPLVTETYSDNDVQPSFEQPIPKTVSLIADVDVAPGPDAEELAYLLRIALSNGLTATFRDRTGLVNNEENRKGLHDSLRSIRTTPEGNLAGLIRTPEGFAKLDADAEWIYWQTLRQSVPVDGRFPSRVYLSPPMKFGDPPSNTDQ